MGMPKEAKLLALSPGVSAVATGPACASSKGGQANVCSHISVSFEDDLKEDATVIRLSAVSSDMQLSTLAPVFDDLGLKVLSYSFDTTMSSPSCGPLSVSGSATIVAAGSMQQLSAAKKESLVCGLRRSLSGSSTDAQPQHAHSAQDQQQHGQAKQLKRQQSSSHAPAPGCMDMLEDCSEQQATIMVDCMAGWNVSSGSSTNTAEEDLHQQQLLRAAAAAAEPGADMPSSNLSRLAMVLDNADGAAASTSAPSNAQPSRPFHASRSRQPRTFVKRGHSRLFLSPLGSDSTEQRLFVSIPKGTCALHAGCSPSTVASPLLSAHGFSISRRPDSFNFPATSMYCGPAAAANAASTPAAATSKLAQVSSSMPLVPDDMGAGATADLGNTVPGAAMVSVPDQQTLSAGEDDDDDEEWWCGAPSGTAVEQVMSVPVRSIHADASMSEAKSLMARYNISALLVGAGEGCEPGIVTKRDLLKASFKRGPKRMRRVRDAMQQPVISVGLGTPIEACAQMLQDWGIRRAPVRDAAKADPAHPLAQFVGVVSDSAIFRYLGLYSGPVSGEAVVPGTEFETLEGQLQRHGTDDSIVTSCAGTEDTDMNGSSGAATPTCGPANALTASGSMPVPALQRSGSNISSGSAGGACAIRSPLLALPGVVAAQQGEAYASTASTASEASSLANVPAFGRCASGMSLAALCEGTEGCSLNRYKCAAALWEMDFDEIEMLRKIGEGSFGQVMLGNLRGTKVAVKRLRPPDDMGCDPAGHAAAFDQFFEREITILASIRHPNVVNFIGACHTPPNCCLVTEYCARGSLDALLHKSGLQLDLVKRIEFAMDVARGMTALHSARPNAIIHRDLKPANLLVSARFEVKVADFGLSRIKDASQLQNSRAGLEGTVEYSAPEVLRGEPFTEKCDVWSFGVVLWELLTRRRPYSDADVPIYLLMVNIGNGTLQLPPVEPGLATPGLLQLLEQCLQQEARARPDFLEVLHALEAEHRDMRRAGSMRMLPCDSHDHSHQEHPTSAWPAAPNQGPPSAASIHTVLRWSDAKGHVLEQHTGAAGAALHMSQKRLPQQNAAQASAATAQSAGSAMHDGDHVLHAATTPFAAAAGAALAAAAVPSQRTQRQRRMSRARSLPMPAFQAWVEEMDMLPVRDSERLQPSGCSGSSGEFGADVAAAVAMLHVSQQQQRQQQQGEQALHGSQRSAGMLSALACSSRAASPFMMTALATAPWSPCDAEAGAHSPQQPGSTICYSRNSSGSSSRELQALHFQPADAPCGSTASVLPPSQSHTEAPQRTSAAPPQQQGQQHTPQLPLQRQDSSSRSCLRSMAAASTPPPHWPGQHRHVSSRLSIQGSYELPPPSAPLSDGAASAIATGLPAPALSAAVLRKQGSQRSMSPLARAAQAAAAVAAAGGGGAAAARGAPHAPAAFSPFAAAAAVHSTEDLGQQCEPGMQEHAQSPQAVASNNGGAVGGVEVASHQLSSAIKPAASPFALMQPAWD